MEENKTGIEAIKADTSINTAEDSGAIGTVKVQNTETGNTDSTKEQIAETDRQVSNKSSLEDKSKADQQDSNAHVDYAEDKQSAITEETERSNKDSYTDTANKDNSIEDNSTDKTTAIGKEDKADVSNPTETADSNNHSVDNTANGKETGNKKLTNIEIYRQGLNKEEQRELARQAGIRSGEARRERRTLGEHLKALLSVGNTQEDICLALIGSAKTGNYKAFNSIRDTIGEMPTQKQEIKANITQADMELLKKVDRRLDCTQGTDKGQKESQ